MIRRCHDDMVLVADIKIRFIIAPVSNITRTQTAI